MPRLSPPLYAIGRWFKRLLLGLGTMTLLSSVAVFGLRACTGGVERNSVLHVTLDGTLREGPSGPVAALTSQRHRTPLLELTEKIRAATDDSRIVGLFLDIKEPELGMAQLAELSRAIDAFHASNKPSWSFMETAGEQSRGDGAFALSSLAKTSMLAPPGMVSLFGMRTDVPFAKGVLERAHVDAHVEKRYEYKSFADTFSEKGFTQAHEESTRSLLGDLQDTYLTFVGAHRNQEPNVVKQWVLQAPFAAEAAKAARLVDQVGYRDEVLSLIEQSAGRSDALLPVENYDAPKQKSSRQRIALVLGTGEIRRGDGGFSPLGDSEGMGSDTYAEALRDAREDGVDGILLRIDSPGGSYLASDVIRREVVLARQQNIPVVVSMGDVAASGGYFIASAADHIVAEAGTITGSIGVVGVSFAVRRALDDFFGLRFGSIDILPHAGAQGFLDAPSVAERKVLAGSIDRIYKDFVDKVADARHRSYSEIHEVAKGRVWTGRQALARGLVDELGGLDVALAFLRKRLDIDEAMPLSLVPFPAPSSAWDVLRDAVTSQAAAAHAIGAHAGWLTQLSTWLRGQAAFANGVQAHL